MSMTSHTQFNNGDRVEVTTHRSTGPYFPATVLRPVAKDKSQILVQYDTFAASKEGEMTSEPLAEFVELCNVRPLPPSELHRPFRANDDVDIFWGKVWRRGTVRRILENSKYCVGLGDMEFDCDHYNLRVHREWHDGSWVPPLPEQEKKSSGMVSCRKIRFKLKARRQRRVETKFEIGSLVEVRSDEEGYIGAWYTCKIADCIGKGKFVVEYQTLLTNDGSQLLREETTADFIRPYPPSLPDVAEFKPLQKVDAWFKDGWWEGAISKVLKRGSTYVVYFKTTNEELKYKHSKLRLHQEWLNGHWSMDQCHDFLN